MYAYNSSVIAQDKNKNSNPQNKTKQKNTPTKHKIARYAKLFPHAFGLIWRLLLLMRKLRSAATMSSELPH
jgi:hypothetical protein